MHTSLLIWICCCHTHGCAMSNEQHLTGQNWHTSAPKSTDRTKCWQCHCKQLQQQQRQRTSSTHCIAVSMDRDAYALLISLSLITGLSPSARQSMLSVHTIRMDKQTNRQTSRLCSCRLCSILVEKSDCHSASAQQSNKCRYSTVVQ